MMVRVTGMKRFPPRSVTVRRYLPGMALALSSKLPPPMPSDRVCPVMGLILALLGSMSV